MRTDTQLYKGILEGCVLKLLETEYLYSGDIVKRMRECGFPFSEGTLCPMLARLDKEGLFDSIKKMSANSPPRKYYKLSEKGLERLRSFTEGWRETVICVKKVYKEDDHAE